MPTIDRIDGYAEELTAIRRDLHPSVTFGSAFEGIVSLATVATCSTL